MKIVIFLAVLCMAVNCFAYDLILKISDDKAQLVADSFSKAYNYAERKLPNETKAEFTKRCIGQYVKEVVKGVKAQEAAQTAQQAAIADPNNEVDIK